MTEQHPMTPPKELLTRWENDWFNEREHADVLLVNAYAAGAQAGADQELEACVKLLELSDKNVRDFLYSARRPKPQNLKGQALDELHISFDRGYLKKEAADTIRRALEQLDD